MNGKSGMVLLLALVCGLGAMYGVQRMMANKGAPVAMREVLVATRDLKVEEVLKEDMVKAIKVPADRAPAGAAGSFKEVAERWLRIPILAEEPIVEGKLAPRNTPVGVVARIPKGMRAFAVEVNEQTGVSGFILPEHRVDVVQAKSKSNNPEEKAEAEPILEDVLVLAAGTTTTRPEDKSIQVRTVTLALTPEQVDDVVAARSKGPLSLALRGVNDHAAAPKKPKKAEPPKVETRTVVVAARDLKPGESIRPEMVRLREVPKADAPTGSLTAPGAAEGKRVQVAVPAGRPVLDTYLADAAGLDPEEGMRAVPLEVGGQPGLINTLHPDARVDVVWTAEGNGDAATATSRLILQDVRVLEVPEPTQSGPPVVMLEVALDDLATLARARTGGALTIALRSPGDRTRYTPPPAPMAPKIDYFRIAIYRGVNKQELKDPRPLAAPAPTTEEEPVQGPAGSRAVADARRGR